MTCCIKKSSMSNLLTALACTCVAFACTKGEPPAETVDAKNELPQVYAVNYPLAYFAERIAGASIHVVFPAPPDVDPAYWSPSADIIADYQQADLVLLNGAGYAAWIQRATLSKSRLVDTSAALADRLIPVDNALTHTHGPSGDHSHRGNAFTTWLDMDMSVGQLRAVFNELVHLRPDKEPEFREGMRELESELRNLDKRLKDVAERIGDRPLVFSHPVYQYLERAYALNGESVHWEPQEMPGDDQWRELSVLLTRHAAGWMIWEGEPLPDVVNRLRSMGIESIVFRPCGKRPDQGNFLRVMLENVMALEQAFPESTS